jgi:hypothetical protein
VNRRRWIFLALVIMAAAYAGVQAQRPHSNLGHMRMFAEGPTGRPEHHVDEAYNQHLTEWEFKISLRDGKQILSVMQEAGWLPGAVQTNLAGWRSYAFTCAKCPAHTAVVAAAPYESDRGSVTEYNRDCPLLEKIWVFVRTGHWMRPVQNWY